VGRLLTLRADKFLAIQAANSRAFPYSFASLAGAQSLRAGHVFFTPLDVRGLV